MSRKEKGFSFSLLKQNIFISKKYSKNIQIIIKNRKERKENGTKN